MSQVRNKSVSSVDFVNVYVPMALAGHSAKEIAAKLYGIEVKDVTKAQIANVTQKSTAMRKAAVAKGKSPDLVPSLKRGRAEGSGNTDFLSVLESLNPQTETPPSDGVEAPQTEGTETPPTGETETQVS